MDSPSSIFTSSLQESQKVPWVVAVESVRLYLQLLDEAAQEALFSGSLLYDVLIYDAGMTKMALSGISAFGPLIQEYAITSLPPVFSVLNTADEVRAKNREVSQILIDGNANFMDILADGIFQTKQNRG